MSFFYLQTPQDMYLKALREKARLEADWNIDNVFNFFVTAYHIQDYVIESHPTLISEVKAMHQLLEMRTCKLLCNKGKHMVLTRNAEKHQLTTKREGGAVLGLMVLGSPHSLLGSAPREEWFITISTGSYNVKLLAESTMSMWRVFLIKHGLLDI